MDDERGLDEPYLVTSSSTRSYRKKMHIVIDGVLLYYGDSEPAKVISLLGSIHIATVSTASEYGRYKMCLSGALLQ